MTPALFTKDFDVLDNLDVKRLSEEWVMSEKDIVTGKKIIDSYINNQLDKDNLKSITFKTYHFEHGDKRDELAEKEPLEERFYLAASKRLTFGLTCLLIGFLPLTGYLLLTKEIFSFIALILLLVALVPGAFGLMYIFYKPYLIGITAKELYFSDWLDFTDPTISNAKTKSFLTLLWPRNSRHGTAIEFRNIKAYQFKENLYLKSKHLDLKLRTGNTFTIDLHLLSEKDYRLFRETIQTYLLASKR